MSNCKLHRIARIIENAFNARNYLRKDIIGKICRDNTDIFHLRRQIRLRGACGHESTAASDTADNVLVFETHESLSDSLSAHSVYLAEFLFREKAIFRLQSV